jgi:hypothetical protein
MSRKPFLASDVLRRESPRKMIGGHVNVYNHLRDISPVPSSPASSRDRSRSISTKRKNSEDSSGNIQIPRIPPTPLLPPPPPPPDSRLKDKVERLSINIAKVTSVAEKVKEDTNNLSCDPVLITNISLLCDAIKLLAENQTTVSEAITLKSDCPPPSLGSSCLILCRDCGRRLGGDHRRWAEKTQN